MLSPQAALLSVPPQEAVPAARLGAAFGLQLSVLFQLPVGPTLRMKAYGL
jgi:hypothetical protein